MSDLLVILFLLWLFAPLIGRDCMPLLFVGSILWWIADMLGIPLWLLIALLVAIPFGLLGVAVVVTGFVAGVSPGSSGSGACKTREHELDRVPASQPAARRSAHRVPQETNRRRTNRDRPGFFELTGRHPPRK